MDENEICVAPNDLLLLLRKTNPKLIISAGEIRKILKKWEFEPQNNTKSYQGIELLSHGEFVKIERRGRYYIIKKDLFYIEKGVNEVYEEELNIHYRKIDLPFFIKYSESFGFRVSSNN